MALSLSLSVPVIHIHSKAASTTVAECVCMYVLCYHAGMLIVMACSKAMIQSCDLHPTSAGRRLRKTSFGFPCGKQQGQTLTHADTYTPFTQCTTIRTLSAHLGAALRLRRRAQVAGSDGRRQAPRTPPERDRDRPRCMLVRCIKHISHVF